jgi:putative exporter of polyketide antibiotics
MIFGGQIVTMGMLLPLALAAAVVLGIITFKSQKRLYGDDHEVALIKALVVGLLTSIPVGLPAFLTVPSAVVGRIHNLRRN